MQQKYFSVIIALFILASCAPGTLFNQSNRQKIVSAKRVPEANMQELRKNNKLGNFMQDTNSFTPEKFYQNNNQLNPTPITAPQNATVKTPAPQTDQSKKFLRRLFDDNKNSIRQAPLTDEFAQNKTPKQIVNQLQQQQPTPKAKPSPASPKKTTSPVFATAAAPG